MSQTSEEAAQPPTHTASAVMSLQTPGTGSDHEEGDSDTLILE